LIRKPLILHYNLSLAADTLSANRFHNPFSSQSQVVLKAPRFRSAELKALHSDSEPTGQNLFFQPGFL